MARHPDYVPGGPPVKIGERHRLLIMLAAMGKTNTEIATELGYGPVRVGIIRTDPKVKLQIEHLQKQMEQETLGTFMDEIVGEARPTLQRLRELRDQDEELPVALGAAKELWESVVPKRTRHEEDKTYRLVIEGSDLKELAEAVAIDKRREIEVDDADVIDTDVVGAVPRTIKPIMPEELEE